MLGMHCNRIVPIQLAKVHSLSHHRSKDKHVKLVLPVRHIAITKECCRCFCPAVCFLVWTQHLKVFFGCLQRTAYNPISDERSWLALRTFLLELFGYITPENQYANTTMADAMGSMSFA